MWHGSATVDPRSSGHQIVEVEGVDLGRGLPELDAGLLDVVARNGLSRPAIRDSVGDTRPGVHSQ